MVPVIDSGDSLIRHCLRYLQASYWFLFGERSPERWEQIRDFAQQVLQLVAQSDAPYHNLEHTVIATLVGAEILRGKQLWEGNVTPADWCWFVLALLCHDVGYVQGICQGDDVGAQLYTTGVGQQRVVLNPQSTGASLTPYHIDRGKCFVQERFGPSLGPAVEQIQHYIELTRFPAPADDLHRDRQGYAGLVRAADLLGQLSDPRYLCKLPLLFQEFAEIGTHRVLGYRSAQDLRHGYPKFYWKAVYPYVCYGISYLEVSQEGQSILASLYSNITAVEREVTLAA